ncbi:MAG: tripartite tricarboxylate transporter substrate binding protein [Pseudomonadota bacterium]
MNKFLSCLAVTLLVSSPVFAQEAWPIRPIKFIVPTAAGGPTDQVARVLADKLSSSLGQPIVVENRAGAGHLVGMAATAQAAPDGYTFGIVSTPLVVGPALHAKMPYDTTKDLIPISILTGQPLVLVTKASSSFKSINELVATAKSRPRSLNMGSAGNATGPHLAGELLNTMADIRVIHVPYKGAPQATLAVISGETDYYFDTPLAALPHVKDGKLRALAVTSSTRMTTLPDIPTVAERGFPGFEFNSFSGLMAPKGTPTAVLARMQAEVRKAITSSDVKNKLAASGMEAVGSTPEEFSLMIAAELPKWRKVVTEAKISAE